jgi:hypothetical protein
LNVRKGSPRASREFGFESRESIPKYGNKTNVKSRHVVFETLIDQQLIHRQKLQQQIQPVMEDHKQKVHDLRKEIAKYMEMGGTPPKAPQEATTPRQKHRDIDYTPEL